jgi:hypothetical protein
MSTPESGQRWVFKASVALSLSEVVASEHEVGNQYSSTGSQGAISSWHFMELAMSLFFWKAGNASSLQPGSTNGDWS